METTDGKICPLAPMDDCIPFSFKEKGEEPDSFKITFDEDAQNSKARVQGYLEKHPLYAQCQHPESGNSPLDNLVKQVKQVGITKAVHPDGKEVKADDNEAGYYYQTYLQFDADPNEPFSLSGFTFYVNIKGEKEENGVSYNWADKPTSELQEGEFTLSDGLVEFGGERSSFWMKVEKVEQDHFPIPGVSHLHTKKDEKYSEKISALVCLSPAYVKDLKKLRELSLLRVTKAITFRFLKSTLDTVNYHSIQQANKSAPSQAVLESKLFQLLDRGSTLYFLNENREAIEKLFNNQVFEQIGYNKYQII